MSRLTPRTVFVLLATVAASSAMAAPPELPATDTAAVAPKAIEVPIEKNAPSVSGHPLTSVVVTQCNLIVAVYMTMQDGRLLRFDQSASIAADELMDIAYSATRSERVEVSCNSAGAERYERHDPV